MNASVHTAQPSHAASTHCCSGRALAPLLIAGLVVRLALWWMWPADALAIRDERDYDGHAVNLLVRGEFTLDEHGPSSGRPPLFPAVLAATYAVVGHEDAAARFAAARLVQSMLGLLLVVQVYFLARGMYGDRIAWWAAAITCFYPSLLGFGNLLLAEILFSVCLLAGLLALARHLRNGSILPLVFASVWLGLATLARSVLWPFFPFYAAFVFFAQRDRSILARLGLAGVAVLAFAATLAPWTVRNVQLQNSLVVVDVLGGRNMMMGNYEHTKEYRAWDTITVGDGNAWDQVLAREHEAYTSLTQGQRDKLAMRRGIQYAIENPLQTARRDVIKFFNFWQLERTLVAGLHLGQWGDVSRPALIGIAAVIFAAYILTLLLGVFGFILVLPEDRRLHWFLLLVVGFICAVHTVVFAHSRYHLSTMPLVGIYAAAACVHWRAVAGAWRRGSFWLAAGICATLVGGWVWEVAVVEWERIEPVLTLGGI